MRDRQTITRGRKFDQVRDGASAVFLRDGYAGASVDDIARAGRVSKATLYSYFPDKKLMFQEVLEAAMAQAFASSPVVAAQGVSIDPGLRDMLNHIGLWIVRPQHLRLQRVLMAESERFPGLLQSYRRQLDDSIMAPLTAAFETWRDAGQIVAGDCGQLARLTFSLLAGGLHLLSLPNRDGSVIENPVAQIACETSDMVCRAHGPRAA
ncbi:TetR/AcrR family transcriptional regulator [Paracoccus bogoriensis]|uniref:TetR/AcrR family transcriptional regulator n=1 Tax=Paracoccus bogoriensis TaxID=242065 RepID=UPI001C67B444|nr:TetR/AcrR family transcriptional regulator [Paracoccus bogoriensis]MBW7056800.1 TetR/AcrR family transcriptional regulator [Paracoccus bogoriensis]